MDKYPLLDLVLTLYDPHFQCKADRLLVIFHFFLIQNGYRVVDDVRQVTHETLYLAKYDQNSISMVYMKKGERIRALHEIAAGRKVSDNHETADVLPIVNDYLYSISMMIDGNQAIGEFIIDNYLIEQTPTYSSSAGVTGPSSIIIMNLDDFVHRTLEVIEELDRLIEEKQGVHRIDPTDDASAEHH